MERVARLSFAIPAVLAIIVLTDVVANGVSAALELRAYGQATFPLVAPLNVLPLSLIACSFWTFTKDRKGAAAVLGTMALALSCLFWISQASGRGG